MLLWSAHCSVCAAPFDEEFGYFATTREAVEQAVGNDWTTTSGGQLVCDAADHDHHTARAGAPGPAPIVPGPGQVPLPGTTPATAPTDGR
ncbi:hypothetical protein [Kitasatospora sp. NPDC051914]|uniref:hypothetical protein n=1 Tax=Kitasatospora sp. NPDC051914 TaxID=3154945 RepID=UPI0034459EF3